MKPFKAFLFLVTLLIFFIAIHYLKEIFFISHNFSETNKQTTVKDSLSFLLGPNQLNDTLVENSTKDSLIPDEPKNEKELINPVAIEFFDSCRIQYLSKKLANIDDEKLPVRILYFGDSQIENDQITGAIRNNLQTRFRGKGPGFVPLDHLYNPRHRLILELSRDWEIQSVLSEDFVNQSLLFKNGFIKKPASKGWFRIKRIQSLNPGTDYEILKLYYQSSGKNLLNVESLNDVIYSGNLPTDSLVGVLDFQFNRTPDNIRFSFSEADSLNILGISLETKKGILVDNIALRGLSYPTFEFSEQTMVKRMIDQINPGLFIFHFGVNLVPYLSDDYPNFRKHFKQQVLFLKENYPDVPLLIIGVSDMARKHKGVFESWPNIGKIKNIQREIAEETSSAFWDLEEFMGGPGGMIRWLKANPKLGRKDYTHFSKEGADIIGNALANLIIQEFSNDSIMVQ